MAIELAFNPPQFYEQSYNKNTFDKDWITHQTKMRQLVDELERLHAALTRDIDEEGVGIVDSVFGRTGDVTALQADYDAFFLTPAEGNAAYSALGHTHLLAAGATDVTATFGELNLLDLAGLTTGWALLADSATTASWQELPASGFAFDTFDYAFDTKTTSTDPGSGRLNFNNATPSSVTSVYISQTDANSVDLAHFLGDLTDGSIVRIEDAGDSTIYAKYSITATTDTGAYWNLNVNPTSNSGTIPANSAAIKVKLEVAPFIESPTTSRALYYAEPGLAGSPLNGLIEFTNIRVNGEPNGAILEFWDEGGHRWDISVNNGTMTMDAVDAVGTSFVVRSDSWTFQAEASGLPNVTIGNNSMTLSHQNVAHANAMVMYIHERDAARGDIVDYGQLWVLDVGNHLMYTNESGTDFNLTNIGASGTAISSGWSTTSGGSITIAANAPIFYTEQAADDAPAAGQGQVWVRNDIPNTLMYTDDTLVDYVIGGALFSGGDVTAGAHADNEIAVWNATANQIEGDSNFTWDGDQLRIYDNVGGILYAGIFHDGTDVKIYASNNPTGHVEIAATDLHVTVERALVLEGTTGSVWTRFSTGSTGGLTVDYSAAGDVFALTGGPLFQIYDSADTGFAQFDHDLTDFNTAFTGTTDWNISGITTLQLGTSDVLTSGVIEAAQIIAGDPGTEGASIQVNGVTYEASAKVSDIGGANEAQLLLHRHSTTLPSVMLGVRSKSDTDAHTVMADNDILMTLLAAGWDGLDSYSLSSEIRFEVDGTPGTNDMPGQITFLTAADGTESPTERMRIRASGDVEIDNALGVTGAVTGSNLSGSNTGDQTTIVGITGTKAQFDTAVTDGNFMYIGDAPTAHTHLLAAGATDVTATFGELNLLDLAGLTAGWILSADTASTASWKAPPASVSATGTPLNNELAVWTNATTIEGVPGLTYNGTQLAIGNTKNISLEADATVNRAYISTQSTAGVDTTILRRASTANTLQFGNSGFGMQFFGATSGFEFFDNTGVEAISLIPSLTAPAIDFTGSLSANFTGAGVQGYTFDEGVTINAPSALKVSGSTGSIELEATSGGPLSTFLTSFANTFTIDVGDLTSNRFEIVDALVTMFQVDAVNGVRMFGGAQETDYAQFDHDGTDFNQSFVSTTNWEITGYTGSMNFNDLRVERPELDDYSVTSTTAVVSANAVTLTYSTAQSYELDLEAATGNVTVTISGGPPSGTYGEMIVKIQQDTTADRTLTWAGGTFVWPGGTEVEPKTGSDSITIYYLSTWNAGTTWYINGVEYG